MSEELSPEVELDLMVYGTAFTDAAGNRIDPLTVVVCGCKQAPWYPPCRHNGGER